MRVPIYEQQTQQNAMQPANLSPEAFGVGVHEAQAKLGQAIAGLGQVGAQYAKERKQRDDQKAVQEASVKWTEEVQKYCEDPTKDENGNTKGILTRQGDNAKGITLEYDEYTKAYTEEYLNKLENKEQREAFKKYTDNYRVSRREKVIAYETGQCRAEEERVHKNYNIQLLNNTYDDPSTLEANIALGIENANQFNANFLGYTDEQTIKNTRISVTTQHVTQAVNRYLEDGNYQAAQDTLDSISKDDMNQEGRDKLQNSIDDKSFDYKQAKLFDDKYSGKDYQLSDGSPDYDRIYDDLKKSYTGEDLEKSFDFQKRKAGEAYQSLIAIRQEDFRVFTNNVNTWVELKGKERKEAYNKAIAQAKETGYDPTDVRSRIEYVNQAFGGDLNALTEEQGIPKYLSLRWDIKSGNGDSNAINAAINGKKITWEQYEGLIKLYQDQLLNPTNPRMKAVEGQLENMAQAKFGNTLIPGTQLKYTDLLKYQISQLTPGKTPDEVNALGLELLKKVETGKTWLGNPKYQQYGTEVLFKQQGVEELRVDAGKKSEEWQSLYSSLGKNVVLSIGSHILSTGKRKDWSVKDVEKFIKDIGGKVQKTDGKYMIVLSERQKAAINALVNDEPNKKQSSDIQLPPLASIQLPPQIQAIANAYENSKSNKDDVDE